MYYEFKDRWDLYHLADKAKSILELSHAFSADNVHNMQPDQIVSTIERVEAVAKGCKNVAPALKRYLSGRPVSMSEMRVLTKAFLMANS